MGDARGNSRACAVPVSPRSQQLKEMGQQQEEPQQHPEQQQQVSQKKGQQHCCSAGSCAQIVTSRCSMHGASPHRAATVSQVPPAHLTAAGSSNIPAREPYHNKATRAQQRSFLEAEATTAISDWPGGAAVLRHALLESTVPVKICLAETEVAALQPPPPLLLLVLRNSYFPHIFATCYEHFQQALRPIITGEATRCPPSFTYQGMLLDWRTPVGVSFDCYNAGPPPVVTGATRARSVAPAVAHSASVAAAADSQWDMTTTTGYRGDAAAGSRWGDARASQKGGLPAAASKAPDADGKRDVAVSTGKGLVLSNSSSSTACHTDAPAHECNTAVVAEGGKEAGEAFHQELLSGQMTRTSKGSAENVNEEEIVTEEEQIVVADVEASGCTVNLPWELTIHFRTPAAVLAAASNARAAAAANNSAEERRDPCCCGCAALRQQHRVSNVAGISAAAETAVRRTAEATPSPGATSVMPHVEVKAAEDNKRYAGAEKNKEERRSKGEEAIETVNSRPSTYRGGTDSSRETGEHLCVVPADDECCLHREEAAAVGCAEGNAAGGNTVRCGVKTAAAASSSLSTDPECSSHGRAPAAAGEQIAPVLAPVPPPAYQGWASFETFLTNAIRQASFVLTGSATAFHSLARAEEAALLRALRSLDVPTFLCAATPLLTPLLLPMTGRSVGVGAACAQQGERGVHQRQHQQTSHNTSSSIFGTGSHMTKSNNASGDVAAEGISDIYVTDSPDYETVNTVLLGADASAAASPPLSDSSRRPGGSPSSELSTVTEEGGKTGGAVPADIAADNTPDGARARGRVAGKLGAAGNVTAPVGKSATPAGAARIKRAVAVAEDASEVRATAAGDPPRISQGRTLRRLPVRVYLVSHCCSSTARGATVEGCEQQAAATRQLGSFSYAVAARTLGAKLCNSTRRFYDGDNGADRNCCCVSSVLLACPVFVPAAPTSNSLAAAPYSASSLVTASEACSHNNSSRSSNTVSANVDTAKGCCHQMGNTPLHVRLGASVGVTSFGSSVRGTRETNNTQCMYTLGDMLHDLLPQLFPVKTWKLERSCVHHCCCNSDSCCCSASPMSRAVCRSQQGFNQRRQRASVCARRRELNRAIIGRKCTADMRSEWQQGVNRRRLCGRADEVDHSCCREANLCAVDAQERIVRISPGRGRVCERHVELSDPHFGEAVEPGLDSEDTDDEEDNEENMLKEVGHGLSEHTLYINSRYEHRSNSRNFCRVLVQGVEPLFTTPVYWLWLNAASFDFFLHVVVLLPPYM